jgi:hypothetical protein
MTEHPPDFAHSPYAAQARQRKAIRIEAALRMGGVDGTQARTLTDTQRREVEHAAGVRRSSDETWEAVFTLLGSVRPPPQDEPVAEFPEQPWVTLCPIEGLGQGDPGICHHCGGAIGWSAWTDARVPSVRFCSEVCANTHLIGFPA